MIIIDISLFRTMSRLLICSRSDVSSVNMRECLMRIRKWDDISSDGKNEFMQSGDMVMMTIPDLHIYAESVDDEARKFGVDIDDVVFMSRHKAASAIPTLTVHPIGNYNNADFGGRSGTLVKASPELMSDSLRILSKMDTGEFKVSYEVTHHGPWLDVPTFFIEIGSDETMWGNMKAAEMLAHVIDTAEKNDFPNAVGIGGGHYAPRFSEIVNAYEVNFGHMIPGYAFPDADDDGLLRMVRLASDATNTKMMYLHRKSMKGSEATRISALLESEGYEMVSSKDFEQIIEN